MEAPLKRAQESLEIVWLGGRCELEINFHRPPNFGVRKGHKRAEPLGSVKMPPWWRMAVTKVGVGTVEDGYRDIVDDDSEKDSTMI